MKNRRYYWFWMLFLPVQWMLVQYLSSKPIFVERFYSNGIYPYISESFRFFLGWLPFSFGDLFYLVLTYKVVQFLFVSFKIRRVRLLKILGILSHFYFAFHLFWGFNYLRPPISESLQLKSTKYSTEELIEFTTKLALKVNQLQLEITSNDTIKVTIPYAKKELYKMTHNGYANMDIYGINSNYSFSSIKHSIISLPLSYMGFSGYLNPFTGEAQVNYNTPQISYPSTSCHEVAHQLGYAAENEANFIGVLAAIHNDNLYFQYSGYYLALRYALNDLYRNDKESYEAILKTIHKGVVKNIIESQKHWSKYNNPFEPLFKSIFNQYLKANHQKSGIKSYNFMVGILLNFNKEFDSFFKD
ncbi:MAG: hypothetical protein BM563_02495 [Bacteroidetes bacterium MedPE-SWsnd-G1]|nr:MAG: hypothetical protein BM563_02495 [Bacteroidetes bacterium MedPE-SWsnd-G1]